MLHRKYRESFADVWTLLISYTGSHALEYFVGGGPLGGPVFEHGGHRPPLAPHMEPPLSAGPSDVLFLGADYK